MKLKNLFLLCSCLTMALAAVPDRAVLDRQIAAMPRYFEPNLGGIEPGAQFVARTGSAPAYLRNGGAAFHSPAGERISLHFLAAHPKPAAEPLDKLPGVSFYAAEPGVTRLSPVPHYARVRYRDLYAGIDVVYYFQGDQLEYDLILQPHADPGVIQFRYETRAAPSLTASGDLVVRTGAGELRQLPPRVYQVRGSRKIEVPARYLVDGSVVRFELGAYDRSLPLTIDPVIVLATGFGGSARQEIRDIAVDASGAIYITGTTQPENFPATYSLISNGLEPITEEGKWAFISKLAPQGGSLQLVYSTVLGFHGQGAVAEHIGIDQFGSAYISGYFGENPWTYNHDAPACSPRTGHIFVTKARLYQVPPGENYLHLDYSMSPTNCNKEHHLEDMAVSAGGAVYLAGWTNDSNFLQEKGLPNIAPGTNGFVVQVLPTNWLDPAQLTARIGFSTLYGGSGPDRITGLALGPEGDMFLTGVTKSQDLPIARAYQTALFNPYTDAAFLARLKQPQPESGQTWRPVSLVYATYLTGNRSTLGRAIAVDTSGNAYITGRIDFTQYGYSVTFPTVRGLPIPLEEEAHGFLTMFPVPAAGQDLSPRFSSLLDVNDPQHVALDNHGGIYVCGIALQWDLEVQNEIPLPVGFVPRHFLARYWQPAPDAALLADYVTWVPALDVYAIAWNAGHIHLAGTGTTLSPLVNQYPAPNKTGYFLKIKDRVDITITANTPGRQVNISGNGCGAAGWKTTPVILPATPGAQCTFTVNQAETTPDTKYIFVRWSNGPSVTSRTITIGSTPTTYAAEFSRQFRLISSVQPAGTGTISPSGTTWQPEGSTVQHIADAAACYLHSGWSAGTVNGATLMTSPMQAIAYFAPNVASTTSAVSIQLGQQSLVDGYVRQQVTLRNTSAGPLYNTALVFDNLSQYATLTKTSGVTACATPAGSPFINVGTLSAGQVKTFTVTFTIAPRSPSTVSFANRILHGLKPR